MTDAALQQSFIDQLLDAVADRVAGRLQPNRKELYTVQDLCERYGVSDDTITRWLRAGEFGETVNPTPRIHLVTLEGVQAFDAAHTGPAYAGNNNTRRRRITHTEPDRI